MLLLERLQQRCLRNPAKVALEFRTADATRKVTYGALLDSSRRAAAWLASHGVAPGDRVAICLPKSLACFQLHLAACSLGAVSMPLNPDYSSAELEYLLRDSEAKLLVVARPDVSRRGAERIRKVPAEIVAVDVEDFGSGLPAHSSRPGAHPEAGRTALMLYTSGTTGRPKGACLTHANLTANMDMLGAAWQWSEDDVLLHALPLFHVHGLLVALHGALHAGATCILHERFDASRALRELRGGEATVFMGVPTMYRRLLDASRPSSASLRHMRLLTSGSDRLPPAVFRQIEKRFGVQVVERYGMTETGIMLSNPLNDARCPGEVGLPLPGVEMRIVDSEMLSEVRRGDIGELQTRGPHVFAGYWRDPEKTARSFTEDGWFRTGDLGRQTPHGRYELKGRATDLIISGGFNVYPAEVEQVLAAHPSVDQCAVTGLPHDEWGEAVTAFVVRRDSKADQAHLQRHCREGLASYKVPKRVVFVANLPRNAMGKVQKAALRETAHELP